MNYMIIVWLCAVIGFTIIEAFTVQMMCIWFAAASLVTLVFTIFGAPLVLQAVVFVVCTIALLIFTRPIVKKLTKAPRAHTNADRNLGAVAIVIEEINNDEARGQVKVNSQQWSARAASGRVIPPGTKVVVRYIEGVKLIVDELAEIWP